MSTRLSHPQISVRAHTGARAPVILIVLLAAAIAGLALLPAAAMAQRVDAASRPTIVLVHGAWAGPAGWEQVVAGLDKDGYATSTPTLGLQSSYADVAIVQATLDTIPGDKILVGHSYGGSVISQAAAGRTDVLGLVYTAAFVPDAGETLIGLGAGYQPPAALQPGHLVFLGAPFASPSLIAPEFFRADFAADLNPKLASRLSDSRARPASGCSSSLRDPSAGIPSRRGTPCRASTGWSTRRCSATSPLASGQPLWCFDEASHAGGYTHYSTRFVKLIEAAADATAG